MSEKHIFSSKLWKIVVTRSSLVMRGKRKFLKGGTQTKNGRGEWLQGTKCWYPEHAGINKHTIKKYIHKFPCISFYIFSLLCISNICNRTAMAGNINIWKNKNLILLFVTNRIKQPHTTEDKIYCSISYIGIVFSIAELAMCGRILGKDSVK